MRKPVPKSQSKFFPTNKVETYPMFTRYLEGVHDYGHESPIAQIMVMSESKNDEDADGGETEVYNFKLKIDR